MWLLLLARAAFAGAYGGLDYLPFGRGDMAWLDASQASGTLVGEDDGLLVPPLVPWGGWHGARDAVVGGLAVARITTTTVVGSGEEADRTVQHVGALRPSLDYRRYLRAWQPGRALPYLTAGLYGVVPSARYRSDTYTEEEQADWDEAAREDRARIAAVGGRAGLGAEVAFDNGLFVGARAVVVLHRGQVVDDEAWRASVLLTSEAALTLGFDFR